MPQYRIHGTFSYRADVIVEADNVTDALDAAKHGEYDEVEDDDAAPLTFTHDGEAVEEIDEGDAEHDAEVAAALEEHAEGKHATTPSEMCPYCYAPNVT